VWSRSELVDEQRAVAQHEHLDSEYSLQLKCFGNCSGNLFGLPCHVRGKWCGQHRPRENLPFVNVERRRVDDDLSARPAGHHDGQFILEIEHVLGHGRSAAKGGPRVDRL
jgi:hypothetical protein